MCQLPMSRREWLKLASMFTVTGAAPLLGSLSARAASEPDPRDPKVRITPAGARGPGEYDGDREPLQPTPQRPRAPRDAAGTPRAPVLPWRRL